MLHGIYRSGVEVDTDTSADWMGIIICMHCTCTVPIADPLIQRTRILANSQQRRLRMQDMDTFNNQTREKKVRTNVMHAVHADMCNVTMRQFRSILLQNPADAMQMTPANR